MIANVDLIVIAMKKNANVVASVDLIVIVDVKKEKNALVNMIANVRVINRELFNNSFFNI